MKIEYKELSTIDDFNQCIDLQKNVSNLSELEVVSPLFLKLIARNDPPIGVSLGVFGIQQSKTELIGYIIAFATFVQSSIYAVLMGIKQEYQNRGLGYELYLKFREIALEKKIYYMNGVFDPIKSNLAHLYFTRLGFTGIKYIEEVITNSNTNNNRYVPNDGLLIRWDFNSVNTIERIKNKSNIDADPNFFSYPIASLDNMPDFSHILIEIPENYDRLINEDFEKALNYRIETRRIFLEYINFRHYVACDCYSLKIDNQRKIYYLLKKQ
jgi:predicted GNAT superfamily acetyltransferase